MKLTEEKPKFQQTNLDESASQGFGIGDASVVIEILRNRLYENKIQTLVQEYMSNARDAHREIGQAERIQVMFPTQSDPNFVVRDFGPGITPERMSTVFVLYGASTKRTTNTQTGGFGIGAKSAWSYTDSFEVTTYVDGVMRIYVAEIGSNKNGALNKIMEGETTEPNGTKISIMVNPRDIQDFCRAIVRGTMFWSEEEYPEFPNAGSWESNLKKAREIGVSRFMDTNISGISTGNHIYSNGVTLVVDGIPYPMPNVGVSEMDQLEKEACYSSLIVHIPNGLVQVAASREKVDDSDASKKALKQIFIAALDDFRRAKANWEATIVDSQTLIDSKSLMCGFQLTSDKKIDYVHIRKGQVQLQTTDVIDGPEIEYEYEIYGVKETRKKQIRLNQRLFAVNGVDCEEASKDNFDINGKDKFYLLKSGNVRLKDIKDWLDGEASEDVVEGYRINLITVLGQQQEFTVGENGHVEYEWKRNADLVAEIVPALERMGFRNIEQWVSKPKPEKSDKPRVTGNLYQVNIGYSETLIPLADLEEVEKTKPWLYFVGNKTEWGYSHFTDVVRILKKAGDVQHGFRVIESRKKKFEADSRFTEYNAFIKSYKPSNETVLAFLASTYVNGSRDTRVMSTAVANIANHMKDHKHPLYKAAVALNAASGRSSDNYTLRGIVTATDTYNKAVEAMRELNEFIEKYVPLCDASTSVEDSHMEEYLAWGLAKAKADGAVLTLPKVLT